MIDVGTGTFGRRTSGRGEHGIDRDREMLPGLWNDEAGVASEGYGEVRRYLFSL